MARNKVRKGRYTAQIEGDFVVFIIGMRFNKLWKVHKWMPPFVAMPRMLRELEKNPDKGYLGGRIAVGGRTSTLVQYWRSFDHLDRFARDASDLHLPAWRRFNSKVGASGDVGVYHETFKVSAGDYETVYSNMPVFGLAAAADSAPIGKRTESARERINA